MAKDKPSLTEKNLTSARKVLFTVTELLSKKNIPYHLEGGTLLGIVRDNDLLPWDYDVDISIPFEQASHVLKLKFALLLKGYKISVRKSEKEIGPIKIGQYSIFKVKPVLDYILYWFLPRHSKNFVVLDIFVKTNDETFTYWQAKKKIMRVENKYYQSQETIPYKGHSLNVPNHYKDYLTEKYGDWSTPIRDWDCGENELTIIK
jgi:lipopolysaccharide cholinephosphotransferase